jgi:hypothetical protein
MWLVHLLGEWLMLLVTADLCKSMVTSISTRLPALRADMTMRSLYTYANRLPRTF